MSAKDLKHLIYFEDLLRETENELIKKARTEGRVIIGTNCYQLPEMLLNLPGCTAVRMRAPHTASIEIGTYYMTSLTCEYCRALIERCVEGGYNFLDCIFDRQGTTATRLDATSKSCPSRKKRKKCVF